MRKITSWVLAILLTTIPFSTFAGSLKAAPINLSLDGPSATAVLFLTNEGQEKITVQLDTKAWNQDDEGVDHYYETRDIVFFPRMLELEPAAKQIIRIGYEGEDTSAVEKTYRIFLQELPVTNAGEMALRFAITMSIPIFIRPGMEHGDVAVEAVTQKQGQLHIKAKNDGNTHVMVKEITINGLDATGQLVFTNQTRGWYLLANRSRTYELPVPEEGCKQAAKIGVKLLVGSKTISSLIDTDTSLCATTGNTRNGATDEDNRQDTT